jgi:DNA-binding NarL/FixJ family response regulator
MRILYLEDDPLDAEALRRALAKLRPEIDLSLAATPSAALARLGGAGGAAGFDAVVVDVSLPEMNGFEFIDRLAALGPQRSPRLLVFTSSEHRFDLEEAARTRVDAYVVKTADPRCFDDLVRALDDLRP